MGCLTFRMPLPFIAKSSPSRPSSMSNRKVPLMMTNQIMVTLTTLSGAVMLVELAAMITRGGAVPCRTKLAQDKGLQ
jgi:hypothetical protein